MRFKGGKQKTPFICTECMRNKCAQCVDVARFLMGAKPMCKCPMIEHSGEPTNKQIKDPITGTVFAPGLSVSEDGTVTFGRGVQE